MARVLRQTDLVEGLRRMSETERTARLDNTLRARGPAEKFHDVGQTNEPGFAPNMANLDEGRNPTGFFRDPAGTTHLRGAAKILGSGDLAYFISGQTYQRVFTLPPAYRPEYNEFSLGAMLVNPSDPHFAVAFVLVASRDAGAQLGGTVPTTPGGVYYRTRTDAIWVSLDNLAHRTPQ